MNNTIKFLISNNDSEKRLDIFLSKKINDLTRSNIKKIIESRNVKINEKIVILPSKKVKLNDLILIKLERKIPEKLLPSKIKLDVHFEDKDILISISQRVWLFIRVPVIMETL